MAPQQNKVETFTPLKRTIGEILSSTSPSIKVPDYQRDYSWEEEHVSAFWEDLADFAGSNPASRPIGKEYFLGAAVLVNNGTYHLLLDGQQRLATSTILLAAIRDKIVEYQKDAAKQINDLFICFEDHMSGQKVFKLDLNLDDRIYFREFIQTFPRPENVNATRKSHTRIKKAYDYFSKQLAEGWTKAGGGKSAFEWTVHIAMTLRENMALVAVISTDEVAAGSIFMSLNDRGLGLSTIDLIRSQILQRASDADRPAIHAYWQSVFQACGTDVQPEAFVRTAWVSRNGDVKTRALYKVVLDSLKTPSAPLDYSKDLEEDAIIYNEIVHAEPSGGSLEKLWHNLGVFKFRAAYPLLISAARKWSNTDQETLAKALISLLIRRNVITGLDRGLFEASLFQLAKRLTDGENATNVLVELRSLSPSKDQFAADFLKASFLPNDNGIVRYMLREFERSISTTAEFEIAGPRFVHIEHVYPQKPPDAAKWQDHDDHVYLLGNLTLLDRRLNQQAKNSAFMSKQTFYKDSGIKLNSHFLTLEEWNSTAIATRQLALLPLAESIWPERLV